MTNLPYRPQLQNGIFLKICISCFISNKPKDPKQRYCYDCMEKIYPDQPAGPNGSGNEPL